ncbi:MAG: hypothetical protein ACR2HP_06790, partial [Ilumatobacteraceae bacterium]
VSVYPIPDGDDDYEIALAPYRSGASTAKFALDKPIPYDVIGRIAALHRDNRVGVTQRRDLEGPLRRQQ